MTTKAYRHCAFNTITGEMIACTSAAALNRSLSYHYRWEPEVRRAWRFCHNYGKKFGVTTK